MDNKIVNRSQTRQLTEYCFVIDKNNKPLAPTKINKGWYLIRKGRAKLKSKYPMIIQLEKEVKFNDEDESYIVCGIDDGSSYVGIAIVQNVQLKTKLFLKELLNKDKM